MPLPVYDTKDAVPAADAADFVEYKGKWHQKDWAAAKTEEERVKTINAGLINEKATAEQQAAAERTRAETAEAALRTGKSKEELDAYAKTISDPIATERDTFKTQATEAQAKLDRIELEKLVRKNREAANLHPDRLDDEDIMDLLLRSVKYENKTAVVVDAEGKATATPLVDHLKRFADTKKYIYAHPGGSGGGMEHGAPGGGDDRSASPTSADKAVAQINAQNDARPNPLAPKKAAKA